MNDQTNVDGSIHDEQLFSEIERALLISGYAGTLRGIQVEVHAGSVVLSGRLPSYYLKQIVQVIAMRVDGVVQVRNGIQVG
ncbi:MAG: BON domain-containing protein [Planctomycetes bacterium]|nr:BON domain-containing protein [Planctomycetota bacterium]